MADQDRESSATLAAPRTSTRASELAEFALVALLPFIAVAGEGGPGRVFGWIVGIAVLRVATTDLPRPAMWSVAAASALAGSIVGPVWFRGTAYHGGMIALSLVGFLLVVAVQTDRLDGRRALILAAVTSVAVLVWSLSHDPGGFLDVTAMHRAGADALRSGASPWEGLSVLSGAPGAEGQVIPGDPYPPVALLAYSLAHWTVDDPRAAGAVAWLVLVVAAASIRTGRVAPLIVLVTSGGIPLMLWTGWTELLTLALIAGGVALWRRPAASSALIGAGLASKQYMVMALPFVLAMTARPVVTRRAVIVGVAAVGALIGFAFGSGYLDATIFAYSGFEPRQDSASLFGFLTLFVPAFTLPFWLGPLAAFVTAIFMAVRNSIDGPAALFANLAVPLTVLFLLGTQAFTNYWFLIWVLLLLARSLRSADGPAARQKT